MPSPIAAFAPLPVDPDQSAFSVVNASAEHAECPDEGVAEELTDRRMWVDGLAHFFEGFSADPP